MNARSQVAGRWIVAGVAAGVLSGAPYLAAQLPRPLAPMEDQGNRVAPFFDGWYANPDGTISYAFGYSNQNKSTVEIPIGADNSITPKEFDGRQPTSFPPVLAERSGGANVGVVSTDAGTGARGAAPASGAAPPAAASAGRAGGGGGGNSSQYARERGAFTVTVPADYKATSSGRCATTDRHGRSRAGPRPARTN
jgi:hypothetical protein